jgi:hypothetical protein
MHPFAVGLICFLAGALLAALYANMHMERREVAAFEDGKKLGHAEAVVAQQDKDRARAQKAAQTRRNKALPDTDFTKRGE